MTQAQIDQRRQEVSESLARLRAKLQAGAEQVADTERQIEQHRGALGDLDYWEEQLYKSDIPPTSGGQPTEFKGGVSTDSAAAGG